MTTNADLLKKHHIYTTSLETMQSYSMAYLGGYQFKRYTRRKRPSEDSSLYTDLIANTVALPVCRYIVDTIQDVLFEPGVKRNIRFCTPTGAPIDPDMTDWSELFMLDADLQNRTLSSFMENVGDLTSIYGHCWVFVDMPQIQEGNLGRPYVCAVAPMDVWDWEWTYAGGKPIVEMVKVKEQEDDDCYTIKVYTLGDTTTPSTWKQYEVSKKMVDAGMQNQLAYPIAEGFYPPGMAIPGFIAYGRRDPRTIDVGVSDIDSAVDVQKEVYKLECEAYGSIQFSKSIIRADKGIAIPVHAGAIARGPIGSIESIKIDTTDVTVITAKQTQLLEDIEGFTGIGGLRNNMTQPQSGRSIIEERKTLHRVAKGKARLLEVTEQQIMTYAARFMDMRWAGQINYNTDYEAHDSNYRMAIMTKAKELAPDSTLIQDMITREFVTMLAPQDEAAEYDTAYIASITDPVTKALMIEDELTPATNDLGDQVPEPETEVENPNGTRAVNNGSIGGANTPITPTGPSYDTQTAIAVQLNNWNVGR